MHSPTETEVRTALEQNAHEVLTTIDKEPGWRFDSSRGVHTETEALDITKACLMLDVPVTDIVTSTAWLKLVERVALLEIDAGVD